MTATPPPPVAGTDARKTSVDVAKLQAERDWFKKEFEKILAGLIAERDIPASATRIQVFVYADSQGGYRTEFAVLHRKHSAFTDGLKDYYRAIEAIKKEIAEASNCPAARETTRELSEAELDAIDALAIAAESNPLSVSCYLAFIGGLDPQTVRALVAGYRRAKP